MVDKYITSPNFSFNQGYKLVIDKEAGDSWLKMHWREYHCFPRQGVSQYLS